MVTLVVRLEAESNFLLALTKSISVGIQSTSDTISQATLRSTSGESQFVTCILSLVLADKPCF